MSIFTALAIYFVIWWIALFVVLPWGVRSQHESDEMAPGTDPGAPVLTNLGRKLVWTTVVATVVFTAWFIVYIYRLITLDQLAAWLGLAWRIDGDPMVVAGGCFTHSALQAGSGVGCCGSCLLTQGSYAFLTRL